MGPTGKVIGIDHIKELVDDSVNNLTKDDPSLISSGRVKLMGKLLSTAVLSSGISFVFGSCTVHYVILNSFFTQSLTLGNVLFLIF